MIYKYYNTILARIIFICLRHEILFLLNTKSYIFIYLYLLFFPRKWFFDFIKLFLYIGIYIIQQIKFVLKIFKKVYPSRLIYYHVYV